MTLGLLPPVVAELLMDAKQFKATANEAEAKFGGLAASGSAMFDKIGKATVLGVAGIGVASVKMAADFETQMTRLYTAAGAPKEAVKGATGEVLKLANSVGESGTAMAEALYHPISAGLDLKTSLQAVKYSAQEAQISGASLDDTTYSLSSVMKAFNQDATQAHDTMALLNSIVGQGDMRFQDFNVSVKNWAPTAAQMGISIQSMGAALAYLTDRGNSAEEASTRVTMGLTMMAYPSQKAGKILQGLGVDTANVTASTEAMTSVMRKTGITQNQLAEDLKKPDGIYVALTHVKKALDAAGVSGTEADAMLSKVFGGGRSDKAILSLLQNLDGLKSKFDDIGAGAGKFDQSWADTQETFSFKLKKMGAEAENLGIQIGSKLIPVIEATVGWFAQHKLAVEALAVVIGGVLMVSTLKWISTLSGSFVAAIAKAVVSVKSLGNSTEEAAAKQAAASTAAGNWGRALGSAIPVIGGVVAGAAMLGSWLSHLGEKSIDATAALNHMSNALLDIAGGSQQTAQHLADLATFAEKAGMGMKDKLVAPIDQGLAALVSGGHLDQAKQALADIDAKLTAAGGSADKFNSRLKGYNDAVGSYGVQQREAALDTGKTTGAVDDLTGAMKDATDAANGTADSINKVDDAFSNLSGRINASGMLHEFQKDLLSVKEQLNQNSKAFNDNTLDGLKNEEAFRQAAQAIVNYRDETVKNGTVLPDAANQAAAGQAKALIDTYEKLGVNKKAVEDYAKSLGLVPKDLQTDVKLKNIAAAEAELDRLIAMEDDLTNGTYHQYTKQKHAVGGLITGEGGPTDDRVPIMASPGEFMMQASAVDRFGLGFMEAINAGSVPAAPAAASGFGTAPGGRGGTGSSTVPVVNVYLDGAQVNGAVRTHTLRYDQRNSGNNLTLAGRGFQ